MKNILSPSILAADFSALAEDVRTAEQAGAEAIHFDVMDGSFVPNISYGAPVISALRPHSGAFFDVHMMVVEPGRYLEDMKKAGADGITVHAEATAHLDSVLNRIRALGLKTGVALNPSTPLSALDWVLELTDMVLIMSVNPGFGGQKLIPYAIEKIRTLRKLSEEKGLSSLRIGVDGGVNLENVSALLSAGADHIIAGSSVFCPRERIGENVGAFLRRLGEEGFRSNGGGREEE